jgi:PAS domain S-box-containing protein
MGARSPELQAYGDAFAWSLLDAAPDATLIVAPDGHIVFANDHAAALFGEAVDDLLERTVEDLLPDSLRAAHRAHRTRYRAEPTTRAMGVGLELRARRADGGEFPVEISLSPLHLDGRVFVVAAVRDVTERVESEEVLQRVIRSLDASDDAVLIFDAITLRYSFVNEGAIRMTGYSREQLLTMSPLHLNPNGTEREYRELVAALVTAEAPSVLRQATMLRRDGGELQVEKTFRSAGVGRDGNSWIITLARDVTARLAAEAELQRSRDAVREAEHILAMVEDHERIAREVYDVVIKQLFAASLGLQGALHQGADQRRVHERILDTIEIIDRAIHDLRSSIFTATTPSPWTGDAGASTETAADLADATPTHS